MNYSVRRKPDAGPGSLFGIGWTQVGYNRAREWVEQNIPDSLECNDYITFVFNNKDAAMRFKLVWG